MVLVVRERRAENVEPAKLLQGVDVLLNGRWDPVLRKEFASQVYYEVAQTLSNPEDVKEEIGQLLASVRRLPAAAAAHPGQPNQEAR